MKAGTTTLIRTHAFALTASTAMLVGGIIDACGAAAAGTIGVAAASTIGPVQPLIFTHPSIDPSVAGMATSLSGVAYTWYRDGTVTAGALTSLDSKRTPYYYTLPPGKTSHDIVAMDINSIDRVYTWYKDGTRSVGTSADLDAYQAPVAYQLPDKSGATAQYAPSDIVDIVISAQDQVRTYYSNGTMSVGTSLNLGATSANVAFAPANNRAVGSILGLAQLKSTGEVVSWYRDGYMAKGTVSNLGGAGTPYSQHLTIYSFKTGMGQSEPNTIMFEGAGPVDRVRGDLGPIHEAILAPGAGSVAAAHYWFSVFTKLGERTMYQSPGALFADFLAGSSDPVRNINTFAGLGDCAADYPATAGTGFCVSEAYDTRAAFDQIGGRFVFLSAARNLVSESDGADGSCIHYTGPANTSVASSSDCTSPRRYVMIAVSVSEDPADGFHLYAVKEANYRDWPTLAVNGNQLIVSHKNTENPDGYVAIVFNLEQMRNGAKRPSYFKLYRDDLDGNTNLAVPRIQDPTSVLTLAVANNGAVYGFQKTEVGYTAPAILKAAVSLPYTENWNFSQGALRLARGTSNGKGGNKLQYGKYPVTTSLSQIVVKTTGAQGATPFGDLAIPGSSYKSFDCPRLAVTNGGDEVIAFAGVRAGAGNKVSYDGAFVARGFGQAGFAAPVAYALGTNTDPTSSYSSTSLITDADHCQQQGGAERDPEGWRVWMMHSYGLEGSSLSMQGALGWVSFQ